MKTVRMVKKNFEVPFWKRVLAYIIDSALINLIVVLPFQSNLKNFNNFSSFMASQAAKEIGMISFIITILTLFYFVIL